MMSHLNSRAGELKSQGATEAAPDPSSRVTAQDAEDVMANESRKAGIAAFQFDPNASPEAKAAQAAAVSYPKTEANSNTNVDQHVPANFHHDKKPRAVGIATDIVSYYCPDIKQYTVLIGFDRTMARQTPTIFHRRAKTVQFPRLRLQTVNQACLMAI